MEKQQYAYFKNVDPDSLYLLKHAFNVKRRLDYFPHSDIKIDINLELSFIL